MHLIGKSDPRLTCTLFALFGAAIIADAARLGLTRDANVYYELEFALSQSWFLWHGVVFGAVAFLLPSHSDNETLPSASFFRVRRNTLRGGAWLVFTLGLALWLVRALSISTGGGRLPVELDTILITTLTSAFQLYALATFYTFLVLRVGQHARLYMLSAMLTGLLVLALGIMGSPALPPGGGITPFHALPVLALVVGLARSVAECVTIWPGVFWLVLSVAAFALLRRETQRQAALWGSSPPA